MNRIPIVEGVTGHRKLRLEDYPLLKEKVKTELKKIKNLVPNSDLVLLDSLSLGGDTICAESINNRVGITSKGIEIYLFICLYNITI